MGVNANLSSKVVIFKIKSIPVVIYNMFAIEIAKKKLKIAIANVTPSIGTAGSERSDH